MWQGEWLPLALIFPNCYTAALATSLKRKYGNTAPVPAVVVTDAITNESPAADALVVNDTVVSVAAAAVPEATDNVPRHVLPIEIVTVQLETNVIASSTMTPYSVRM